MNVPHYVYVSKGGTSLTRGAATITRAIIHFLIDGDTLSDSVVVGRCWPLKRCSVVAGEGSKVTRGMVV